MTTDFRALYVDLLEEINSIIDVAQGSRDLHGGNDDLNCLASIALITRRANNALAKPLPTPTVQNEALPND